MPTAKAKRGSTSSGNRNRSAGSSASPAARRFCAYYDITSEGNWEGKNIAHTPRTLAEVAEELNVPPDDFVAQLDESRAKVYQARLKRIPPLLDDKRLTAWNGLMIGAMAEAYRVLRDARFLESAERAARDILKTMIRPDGGLFRTARHGKAHLDAYLEDYAYLADALLDLYESGGAVEFLERAQQLAERMIEDFGDPEGGAFFHTAHGHEKLIARTREGHDGALPSPNAVAARALARLSLHLDAPQLRARAETALRAYGRLAERSPRAFATTLTVADFLMQPPTELVFAGQHGSPELEALAAAVARHFLPNRVVAHVDPSQAPSPLDRRPLVADKGQLEGKPALYVCENFSCQAPISKAEKVADALQQNRQSTAAGRQLSIGRRVLLGSATAAGTSEYAKRFGAARFSTIAGLHVSGFGFGGYRIDDVTPAHRRALRKALSEGVNLIDTSTNYEDGRSERLVGEVLAEMTDAAALSRSQIVVVSKIGYAQGKNFEIAAERDAKGRAFPEMVKLSQGLWHCVHPEWLDDQLTRSLDRLGLECLDVCLLHNPEYYFSDAVKRGKGPLSELRNEFYRRLTQAFRHFEEEIQRGRLKAYGVSSNTSVAAADDREATDLTRMLEAAQRAGGENHHFRVLQLPFNLLEPGAAQRRNNKNETQTVLQTAAAARVSVLINRPLNALVEGALVRLADPPPLEGAPPLATQLNQVEKLEQKFRDEFAPALRTGPGNPPAETLLNWATQLSKLPQEAATLAQWDELESQIILPRVNQVLGSLTHAMSSDKAWRDFQKRYATELEKLLLAMRKRASDRARQQARSIHEAVDTHLPEALRTEPLSRKALAVLHSTPGVTSVLVGMRQERYVADVLEVGAELTADQAKAALHALSVT